MKQNYTKTKSKTTANSLTPIDIVNLFRIIIKNSSQKHQGFNQEFYNIDIKFWDAEFYHLSRVYETRNNFIESKKLEKFEIAMIHRELYLLRDRIIQPLFYKKLKQPNDCLFIMKSAADNCMALVGDWEPQWDYWTFSKDAEQLFLNINKIFIKYFARKILTSMTMSEIYSLIKKTYQIKEEIFFSEIPVFKTDVFNDWFVFLQNIKEDLLADIAILGKDVLDKKWTFRFKSILEIKENAEQDPKGLIFPEEIQEKLLHSIKLFVQPESHDNLSKLLNGRKINGKINFNGKAITLIQPLHILYKKKILKIDAINIAKWLEHYWTFDNKKPFNFNTAHKRITANEITCKISLPGINEIHQ